MNSFNRMARGASAGYAPARPRSEVPGRERLGRPGPLTQPRTLAPLLATFLALAAGCSGGPGESGGPGAAGGSGGAAGAAGDRPSILLVVVDTLRADRLGAWGYPEPTSPRIDAFAAGGTRLERYTTVVPSTLASFTSILTSRHPHTHGVYRNGIPWPEELEGMQGVLAGAGYRTAAFVSSYCLTRPFGIARGFETFDERLDVELPGLPFNSLARDGADTTDAVLAWLASRPDDGRPFFAMVHYFDPHWPYTPPEPYAELFDPGYAGPVTGSMEDLQRARALLAANRGRGNEHTRHLERLHLGEIRHVDDQFGRLLDGLRAAGLDGSTVVAFTSDHGETFDEHGDFFDHGASVYDTNIHVPLALAGPGIAAGRVLADNHCSLDLAPTLLELAGVAVPEEWEGRSFAPRLAGAADPGAPAGGTRTLFAEATKPHAAERGHRWPNRGKARAAIAGRFKLIEIPWAGGRRELYDLVADPLERNDLGADPAARPAGLDVDDLGARLDRWSRIVPESELGTLEDEEVLERLRALGYVR